MNDNEVMELVYYKQGNYDGVNELYKKVKIIHPSISKTFVENWLNKQTSHQQTKVRAIKHKEFLPIYSELPYSFQIDLTFFPRYKKQNDNNTVLFTAININTRFAYYDYSDNKSMKTIMSFIIDMAEKTEINSITCDEGLEFNNREFKKFCIDNEINIYFVKGDGHKLGIVNRFHRTLKNKLSKYFIAKNTVRWIDVIDKIIYNYNHTVHRGIGMEPYKVNGAIEHQLIMWKKSTTKKLEEGVNKEFLIGDKVRIENNKKLFDDKMISRYSSKKYTVVGISNNSLNVEDKKGNVIKIKKKHVLKVIDGDDKEEQLNIIGQVQKEQRALKKDGIDDKNIIVAKRR